ncbi:MAG: Transposase [uncultured Chloroflexia bacterium]|uniref:Transposase n=1 Tax=uncultured Chloroflexia bacterium TaxID=1672391 RepID=A0A6J4KEF7_9CHLR|nr:MAG: Transposase [uncultured Chloroflexia bacterium]
MTRLPYDSDLPDEEWTLIEPFVKQKPGSGRKRTVDTREIVNALCYMTRTGCQWRMLPHDFPAWQLVSYYYRQWLEDGTLEEMNDVLREDLRIALNKDAEPSVAIMDSQSVKTAGPGAGRGFDGAKLVKGRKRHCLVDTLGLLLVVMVTAASLQESEGGLGILLDVQEKTGRLKKVYADQGYKDWLVEWCGRWKQWVLEIVKKPAEQQGFVVHPKRWIVERFFAWLNMYRRLSKDYERTTTSSEGMIYLVSIQLMARRLARRRKEMYS